MALTALVTVLAVGLLSPTSGASGSRGDGPVPLGTSPFQLKVGTFNILGSQHTARPGGFAPGHVRAGYTADLISMKKIDVIGLQEVQQDQLRVLGRDLDKYWIWPYKRLGTAQGLRLQIAYKRDAFDLVEAKKIYTRFDGNRRPIPYVRLRDRASGQEFWFMTFHNSPKAMEAERDRATQAEIALVNRLRRTGVPVVIGGDTNEWVEFFCKMGRGAEMHSASGGRLYPACRAAANPVFDYVMANPRLDFFRYRQLGGRVVWRASDHKLVTAKVRLADAS
ncbi:MAG: endonuclease/exonuclease/phosphatase family protein [Nocardioides sp.]